MTREIVMTVLGCVVLWVFIDMVGRNCKKDPPSFMRRDRT